MATYLTGELSTIPVHNFRTVSWYRQAEWTVYDLLISLCHIGGISCLKSELPAQQEQGRMLTTGQTTMTSVRVGPSRYGLRKVTTKIKQANDVSSDDAVM